MVYTGEGLASRSKSRAVLTQRKRQSSSISTSVVCSNTPGGGGSAVSKAVPAAVPEMVKPSVQELEQLCDVRAIRSHPIMFCLL